MSRIKISVLKNSLFLSWRMSIMSFFLFYVFLKEKGKGGIKPRNSSRSGFSRARRGRGTYYRGVGSDPHAEGRGRGREEQRGRGSVNDGQRRSRGRRGNFVLLPFPPKKWFETVFFPPWLLIPASGWICEKAWLFCCEPYGLNASLNRLLNI